jgi:hypothetical protein
MSLNLEKYQSLVTLLDELRQGIITQIDVVEVHQRLAGLKQLFANFRLVGLDAPIILHYGCNFLPKQLL